MDSDEDSSRRLLARVTCSGGCSNPEQIKYDYLSGYFNAHMLSPPSWRYFYWLWFILAVVLLLASAAHFAGLGQKTYLGACWNKWATKNRVIKLGKKPGEGKEPVRGQAHRHGASVASYQPVVYSGGARRTIITFPSFGRMLVLAIMLAIPISLSLIGADYINPNAGVFDLSQSFPNGTVTPSNIQTYRRRSLWKRIVQWGQGDFPDVTTFPVNTTIPYHTWWTLGGRLGGMTNALTPFVLLLALKQVPFALLSLKIFGGFSFDRLSFLHKWGGRLVWLFATAHICAWSVQLASDTALGGQAIYSFAFMWGRFRWGWVVSVVVDLTPTFRDAEPLFEFGNGSPTSF